MMTQILLIEKKEALALCRVFYPPAPERFLRLTKSKIGVCIHSRNPNGSLHLSSLLCFEIIN